MALYQLRVLELHNVNQVRAEIANIGADSSWLNDRTDLEGLKVLRLENILPKLARFLYQEMMMEGGQVALPARMDDRSPESVHVLIFGNPTQFDHLNIRIRTQSVEELDILADEMERLLE